MKNLNKFYSVLIVIFVKLLLSEIHCYEEWKSIYHKISNDKDLSTFNSLIKKNHTIKMYLNYFQVTVFAVENVGFNKFEGVLNDRVVHYHVVEGAFTLKVLFVTKNISTVMENTPPLWVTVANNEIYINNARIITEKSNFLLKTREDDTGKYQVLHVIDEVLNPVVQNYDATPMALDFLNYPSKWNVDEKFDLFSRKIDQQNLNEIYNSEGGHTFFVPIDETLTIYKYKMLDTYTIYGHIIPNKVLFTRATEKGVPYESMSNEEYINIRLTFEEIYGKLYIKSTTVLGDSSHPKGDVWCEIIKKNIPVKNGVVHVISKPLAVFEQELKLFPQLPVYYKISSDPFLDFSFKIGVNTGLNFFIQNSTVKCTYFVPNNEAWKKVYEQYAFSLQEQRAILARHIILSDSAYEMSNLLRLSKDSFNGSFVLKSLSGPIILNAVYNNGSYYLNYEEHFIQVSRADYICDDGIVHIINSPLLTKKERQFHLNYIDKNEDTTSSYKFWKFLKDVIS